MTEIEQQIYNDLGTAGWNLFTDERAKIDIAQYLARKGYTRPSKTLRPVPTTPLAIKRFCTGKSSFGSEGSATYIIHLSREATLREFIELILQTYPSEWGQIGLSLFHNPLVDYQAGSIEHCYVADLDFIIEPLVEARGGWSLMNYVVAKKKNEPEQKEASKEWDLSHFSF